MLACISSKKQIPVYQTPDANNPPNATLIKDDLIQIIDIVIKEGDKWVKIRLQNGSIGYIKWQGVMVQTYMLYKIFNDTPLYPDKILERPLKVLLKDSKVHIQTSGGSSIEAVDSSWKKSYIAKDTNFYGSVGRGPTDFSRDTRKILEPFLFPHQWMTNIFEGIGICLTWVLAFVLIELLANFIAPEIHSENLYLVMIGMGWVLFFGMGFNSIGKGIKKLIKKLIKSKASLINESKVIDEDELIPFNTQRGIGGNMSVSSVIATPQGTMEPSAMDATTAVSASPQTPIIPPVDTVTEHLDKMKDLLNKPIKCPMCGYTSSSYYIYENKRICKNCGVFF